MAGACTVLWARVGEVAWPPGTAVDVALWEEVEGEGWERRRARTRLGRTLAVERVHVGEANLRRPQCWVAS